MLTLCFLEEKETGDEKFPSTRQKSWEEIFDESGKQKTVFGTFLLVRANCWFKKLKSPHQIKRN